MKTQKVNQDQDEIIEFKRAPLVPIRNVVVFPGIVQPLTVGRTKSINSIESAMKRDRFIVVTTQKNESIEDPLSSDLYPIGLGAEVLQVIRLPDSTLRVIIEGFTRVYIKKYINLSDRVEVEIEPVVVSKVKDSPYVQALSRELIDNFELYFQMNKRLSPDNYIDLINVKDLDKLADMIASAMVLPVDEKQDLLATFDIQDRIKKLLVILQREINVLKIQGKIESEVKGKFDKTQKDYFLREQLRAIQKELGEMESEFSDEIKKYRTKMEEMKLSPEIVKVIEEELSRLQRMPPMMAEAGVVRNYLDWMLSIPWDTETIDQLDLVQAKKILDDDHYGLQDVKERILEFLAVKKLSTTTKSPILCLVGPPGVGKTSLGKSIARAMGRKFMRISLGGIHDEAEIRGHRRTYVGAQPGRIIQGMKQVGTKNPIFLLDEIDKIGADFRGDPSSALLEALDPEQNSTFSDHYLEVPFDLSKVFFVTTGNVTHTIPPALKDRMEIITISGYTEEEKFQIAKKFLIPKQLEANGLKKTDVSIKEATIYTIIREYTIEAGLRNLERQISKIFRKIALTKATQEKDFKKITIKDEDLIEYLRAPISRHESKGKTFQPGIVTGLAYTEVGGEILFVESTKMKGKGNLILTGQLGDVMKESATAALTYIRSKTDKYKMDENFNESIDIHVHVPEGAVPKDGPSAGITLYTSLLSLLLDKKIPADIAMTGEITIKGRILPIGGLKDKLLAANRAGIKKVFIPKENEKNLIDIPEDVKSSLQIVPVETLDELYQAIFLS